MSDKTIGELDQEIYNLQVDIAQIVLEDIEIQEQISALRARLTKTKEKSYTLKNKRRQLEKDRESAARQEELRKEQEHIEEEFALLKAEVDKIVSEAPWKDDIFQWQIDGAAKLAAAGKALLADTRGMGKTLTALAWLRLVGGKKVLVLTRKQYAREFIKEMGIREPNLPVIPLLGPNASQRKTITNLVKNQEEFVLVCNYEMWRRNTDQAVKDLIATKFKVIIADEAHRLKNSRSSTTKGFLSLVEFADNILEMTGSPVQNRPQELFILLHALYPQHFPGERKFIKDFCDPLRDEQTGDIIPNRWTWKEGGLDRLMLKLNKFFIARTPADVGHKVPPPHPIEYELDFEGYPEQEELYKLITLRNLAQLKSGKVLSIPGQLAVMMRQQQVVDWPAGITFKVPSQSDPNVLEEFQMDVHQSAKLDWAEDLIKELVEEGQSVVFFSRFKASVYELKKRLANSNIRVGVVTGDEPDNLRQEVIDDFDLKLFNENPKYDVLLATYDTVGESVNLNRARHAILYDYYWKPSNEDQASGRIDRINSVDQATLHFPLVLNTIDEYMKELISQKRDVAQGLKAASDLQAKLIANLEQSLK